MLVVLVAVALCIFHGSCRGTLQAVGSCRGPRMCRGCLSVTPHGGVMVAYLGAACIQVCWLVICDCPGLSACSLFPLALLSLSPSSLSFSTLRLIRFASVSVLVFSSTPHFFYHCCSLLLSSLLSLLSFALPLTVLSVSLSFFFVPSHFSFIFYLPVTP